MGGGSKSSSTTDKSTRITTTTKTDIAGDIGLTGTAAVDLARVAQETAKQAQASTSKEFQRFAGSAELITTGALDVARSASEAQKQTSRAVAGIDKTPTQLLAENAPLLLAAGGAVIAVWAVAR